MHRPPRSSLRPFVESVWAIDDTPAQPGCAPRREHVIPTGQMHLVFRLTGGPLRLFDGPDDRRGRPISTMVIGGPRDRFYIKEASWPLCSVGAQLRPGAAEMLFGVHADELSQQHTALEDLWGGRAALMLDELASAPSSSERLDVFERLLSGRLPVVRGLHPAVAQALQDLDRATPVGDVVKRSGYSHRRLITLFSRAVGLTPKVYGRVRRFQDVLHRACHGQVPLIEIAARGGYSDQSHFTREFRDMTGLTPGEYRGAAPVFAHHVEVAGR